MFQTNQDQNYRSPLGLKQHPFAPKPDATFYYPFESFEQRLQVLNRLVQGMDLLVLVIGEFGSGKTSLLHRYLVTTDIQWKTGRIHIDPTGISDKPAPGQKLSSYPIFAQQNVKDPVVIVDDAHHLSKKDLRFLLQEALVPESSHKIKRLVLFGEPGLSTNITALSESTASDMVINKITMPALTRVEVDSYLQYRTALAGHTGESLFKPSVVKMIHKKSAGLPGRINECADQWLKKKYSPTSQSEGIFTLLKKLPLKAAGWIVVGIVAVVLGVFIFNQRVLTPRTSPDTKKATIRVFRAKIPAFIEPEKPKFINRVSPKAEAVTPEATAEVTPEATVEVAPEATAEVAPEATAEVAPEATAEVAPEATAEVAPEATVVTNRQSPPAKQPAVLAKVPPQRIIQPQVKPPPIKPTAPRKVVQKNTIYRESWLLDQDSSFYTLQVLGVRKEEWLLNFIKTHKLLLKQNVAYYKTVYRGQQWYPLLYGVYPTKSEAANAVKELPDKVQKSIPWIRKISAIQKEVRAEAMQ
ncbi:MAG: SPOR domain-containing protein [Desulfobacterales bacterium]